MTRLVLARSLSILGHPVLLMPAAAAWASAAHGQLPSVVVAGMASVFVAVCVAVFSVLQVRAGRWGHVDASVPGERSQLNLFLLALLMGTAVALWAASQPRLVPLGLLVGAAIIALALVLRRAFKMSLHVAFAAYAVCLLWPNVLAVLLGVLLVAGVAWSRLALSRHTLKDVVAGWVAGVAAGAGFQMLAAVR